ncbi:MAG: glutamine amidotransferase [Acidimicrobiales bacterium]
MTRVSAVRIAVVLPELLGTYGDGGNGIVLEHRLRWRGIAVERIECGDAAALPETADLYLLGGGEDRPQTLAARELRASGAINRAHSRGAVIFAVCAGYQIVGQSFPGAEGDEAGLGLLDVTTTVGAGPRAVGELLIEPDASLGLPLISGFENHQGVTAVGRDARVLGRVLEGVGNGRPERPAERKTDPGAPTEGAVAERVVATYAHGPVLARNPALADWLLAMIVGPLDPLEHEVVAATEELRRERLAATRSRSTRPG